MRGNILWKVLVVITVMLFPSVVFAYKAPDDAKKAEILKQAYHIQVPFIENMGQVKSKDVSFYARTSGGTVFVEKNGTLTYNLHFKDKKGVVIKEIFTDKTIKITGLKPSPTRVNYFKGKDKSNWKANIPCYDSISLGEIYKGIDLTLKAYGNNVEKLFTVLPEENPEIIRVKITGAKGLKVNERGGLEVITELGPVSFTKPLAYQNIGDEKKIVEVAYVIYKGNTYGFKVGNYDQKRPLIIDPLLASTFVGGGINEYGHSIAIDGMGNVYVTGCTNSSGYPTTSGVYDESHNVYYDVFVSKLDSSLGSLLASTFVGGSNYDYGYSIAIDGMGNVYVTGRTNSSGYPTTSGVYDESFNGSYDVFVSKLDSSLGSLLASTFVGGGDYDLGHSIAIDGSGNVYVTGQTYSSGYPTTSGVYDESHNGSYDVFVSRLDSSLSSLLASTFVGGGDYDEGHSIAIDGSGNVYVTGRTNSSGYPTTSGVYDESHNGINDVFVSRLDSSLSSLLASTFVGGSDWEEGYSIAIDGSGNVYVTGGTRSSGYPTTSGVYDESHNGSSDVFVSKLDSSLGSLLASTFVGGGVNEYGYSIAIDAMGNVYVTGYTYSSDYPTTSGAYDESHNGDRDVFASMLDSNLSSLLASTFVGGSDWDEGYSIVLDAMGNVYVTGYTMSSDYPATPSVYDESHNGDRDVFVSMLDRDLSGEHIAVVREKTTGKQGLFVYSVPLGLDGETEPPVATDRHFGNSNWGNNIIAMTCIDTDGNGADEIAVIRQRPNGRQRLEIYNPPQSEGGDTGSPIASDLTFGHLYSDKNNIAMAGVDINGDGIDEIAVIREKQTGKQRLFIFNAPQGIGGQTEPAIATDMTFGFRDTGRNIMAMTGLEIDGDEPDEIAVIMERASGRQRLEIYNAPQAVGGETGPPIASDLTFGESTTKKNNIALTSIDINKDNMDEIAVVRQGTYGWQRLEIYNPPEAPGGEAGPPIASDLSFGEAGTDRNTIFISGMKF